MAAITPAIVTGLSSGQHTYRLTLSGYQDETGDFSIIDGQTTTVNVIFTGNVSISSTPSGADIWIDDLDLGVTSPNTIMGLSQGTHNYILKLSGYQDIIDAFDISPGQTTTISVTLSPILVADIISTSIDLLTSQTPCKIGTCTVTVNVIWQNIGGSSGTFTPSLNIDGIPIISPYAPMILGPGEYTPSINFDITSLLTIASHLYTICPEPS